MDTNPASPPDLPAPDWSGHGPLGRAERRLAALDHLAGVGIRLADAFAEKAFTAANTAWIEPDCHVDPGIPFANMVRAVRQTYALQVKFEKEARLAAAAQNARRDPDRRIRRRRLIKDAITATIKDTADPNDAERLFRDLEERLHDEEADERFDDGPVAQVVARLCTALGVSIDLSLFEDQATGSARPHSQATGPGTPSPAAARPAAINPPPGRPDTPAAPRRPGLPPHPTAADNHPRPAAPGAPRRPTPWPD